MSDLEDHFAWQLRVHVTIPPHEREYRFALPRRFRADFAWPADMLLVEIDGATWSGGRHARGAGIERDAEKYSLAAALGWRVIRLTRRMVEDGSGLALVEQALARDDAPAETGARRSG